MKSFLRDPQNVESKGFYTQKDATTLICRYPLKKTSLGCNYSFKKDIVESYIAEIITETNL